MKKYYLIFILVNLYIYSFGQFQESKAVDSIFSDWSKSDVPGCALGIIKDGELIYAKGYGLANMEYDIPNSDSSVFRIGSTSKQFTAACVILLAEQGKLSLDDNLKMIFPDFPDYAEKITIRHLLNHTSGIRDYLMIAYLKGLGDDDFYTDADVMNWLTNQSDLNFQPGDEFLYSNSGYWLLGQIVNKVSGKNMADFARDELFSPLGMNHTHFHNDHTQIVKNRASGYAPSDDKGYKISMTTLDMIGDGGIFTTINDIKKWDDAFYKSEVLSRKFWSMMTQKGILNSGEVIDYASGLDIGEYKGLKTIRHGGAFVGFRADLLRFPEQRLSIAIFANRSDANPSAMANSVADILLKDDIIAYTATSQSKEDKNVSLIVLPDKDKLALYCGNYWNDNESIARKIYVKNDTLRYFRNQNSESTLVPVNEREFKMINVYADVRVIFSDEAEPAMTVMVNGGQPSIYRQYEPVFYDSEDLVNYEGRYYSTELDVHYSLIMEGDALVLYIDKHKISPLNPIMKNLFSNDQYGIFRFSEDQKGKLSSFRLSAGRVKNLKFEKE